MLYISSEPKPWIYFFRYSRTSCDIKRTSSNERKRLGVQVIRPIHRVFLIGICTVERKWINSFTVVVY